MPAVNVTRRSDLRTREGFTEVVEQFFEDYMGKVIPQAAEVIEARAKVLVGQQEPGPPFEGPHAKFFTPPKRESGRGQAAIYASGNQRLKRVTLGVRQRARYMTDLHIRRKRPWMDKAILESIDDIRNIAEVEGNNA